jgi:hypothetical protein
MHRLLKIMVFTSAALSASAVNAEACTYNEALMAFQQGNTVRGQALLSMAAKDGDQRAAALFSALQEALKEGVNDVGAVIPMSDAAMTAGLQ